MVDDDGGADEKQVDKTGSLWRLNVFATDSQDSRILTANAVFLPLRYVFET